MYIFLNDKILPEEDSYINIKDRGLLLGDGLFETCKVRNGRIEFFNEHFDRLVNSSKQLCFDFCWSRAQLLELCNKIISANNLENSTASLRVTITRGSGARGISVPNKQEPTLLITSAKFTQPTTYPSAYITSIKRNQFSPIVEHKTLNYLEPILARQEARTHGFDEGIMLNIDGYISESSIANIFFIKNGIVMTPSIKCGILPGIIRNQVISLCKKNQIPIIEKCISISDALNSDEVFQTNSLIGIQLISRVNDQRYATQTFGLTNKLCELYEDTLQDSHISEN